MIEILSDNHGNGNSTTVDDCPMKKSFMRKHYQLLIVELITNCYLWMKCSIAMFAKHVTCFSLWALPAGFAGPAGHMSKASRTRCSRTGPVTALSLDANFPGEESRKSRNLKGRSHRRSPHVCTTWWYDVCNIYGRYRSQENGDPMGLFVDPTWTDWGNFMEFCHCSYGKIEVRLTQDEQKDPGRTEEMYDTFSRWSFVLGTIRQIDSITLSSNRAPKQ